MFSLVLIFLLKVVLLFVMDDALVVIVFVFVFVKFNLKYLSYSNHKKCDG